MNDLDLIERLRAAGTQAPADGHSPEAVLAAGRRAASRRNVVRISGATLGLAVAVLAGSTLTGSAGTQVVTAADGAPGDGGSVPSTPAELDPDADRVNAAILQQALGKDFDVRDDMPVGTLVPGSESAANLPANYSGTVSLVASVSGPAALKQQCVPMTEKGSVFEACQTRTLSDGREVQARFSRWAPTAEFPQATAGETVRVLFLQPNNTLVWVDLVTSSDAEDTTAETGKLAQAWIEEMVDRLGAAAADPDVEPVAFDSDAGDPAEAKAEAAKKAAAAKQAEEAERAATAEDDAAAEKAAIAKKMAATQEAQEAEGSAADKKAAAVKKAEMAKQADAAKRADQMKEAEAAKRASAE